MREAPRHIEVALRAYDPDLGIMWDAGMAGWFITHRGDPRFLVEYADGHVPQSTELSETEIMGQVGRNDRFHNHDKRMRAMAANKLHQRYRADQARQKIVEERKERGRQHLDFLRRGASKPFIRIANNPLSKGA
jgi:hypothetical protein